MTCTWNIRRHTGRLVAVAGALAMVSGLAVSPAAATDLGDLQAQASALAARIATLGSQESQLAERYDGAVNALHQVEADVAKARRAVAAANVHAGRARSVLRTDALNAYVTNGAGSLTGSGPAGSIAGADSSLLRAEYEQSLATNQHDSEDQYALASRQANSAGINLKRIEAVAAANVRTIAGDERQVEATQQSLQAAEAQDKGRIATLIAQQQAAAERAAQLAAEQRLAAQRAAAQRAAAEQAAAQQAQQAAAQQAAPVQPAQPAGSGSSGTDATTTTTAPVSQPVSGPVTQPGSGTPAPPVTQPAPVPPPSSSAAATAVSAAESRIGDPYVWGAAGPSAFDCSGLVMWAYAQAGISLPHYSGAQYADTTHISMSDLQPGDLVFFADPGEHVAMYVGNGDIIEAPYTGATVHIVPMYGEFVLASRVA